MSNPTGGIQIDDDWKRQAQEEKRRLAEQTQSAAGAATTAPPGAGPAGATPAGGRSAAAATAAEPTGRRGADRRELPPVGFATLVQSIMTQALLYLGELAVRGGEPMLDLDAAKRQIDTLGVLEEKTRGNLTPDEQKLLDSALYDLRNRFVSAASQMIM